MNKKKGIQLTERDRYVLLMVYNYDSCGYEHIKKRLFPTISKHKFYERMKQLKNADYLDCYRCPSIYGIGAGKYLCQLGRAGRREVADMIGCTVSDLREPRKITRAIPADHQHGICDFRVTLELGLPATGMILFCWLNERELRGKPDRVPDASFILAVGDIHGDQQRFRLEVDRSTISYAKRMVERLKSYQTGDDRSPVLWVVPDSPRAEKLASWSQEAGGDTTVTWITIAGSDPLDAVWNVVGGPANARLTP